MSLAASKMAVGYCTAFALSSARDTTVHGADSGWYIMIESGRTATALTVLGGQGLLHVSPSFAAGRPVAQGASGRPFTLSGSPRLMSMPEPGTFQRVADAASAGELRPCHLLRQVVAKCRHRRGRQVVGRLVQHQVPDREQLIGLVRGKVW